MTPIDDGQHGSVPVPDPTLLTTQQLLRELAAVRELFDSRLSDRDKAIALLQQRADGSPSIAEVSLSVKHLKELMSSLFDAVTQKFEGNAVALGAAFAASKEAVAEQQKSNSTAISKSEATTSDQLKQLQTLWATSTSAINDKFDDLKTRLNVLEAKSAGGSEERTSHRQNNAFIITIVIAAVAVSGLMVNVINTWTIPPRIERVIPVPNGK